MTGPGPIDLLLSDIDGTLVTGDKVLTPAALAAAQALRDAGVGFALTSARPPRGMRMLIEPLRLQLPLAGFNGGLIVAPDFTVLESYPLDGKVAEEAAALVLKAGLDLWVYGQNSWVVSDANGPHVAREAWVIDMQPVVRPCGPEDFAGAFRIVGVSSDAAKVAAAQERVTTQLGGRVSATRSQAHFLDITQPKANKGAVVQFLAGRLNLSPTRIATIGDMPNDVLMFAQSGFSIAMGNATDEVKAKAKAVTASNEDDGFAAAVRQFILPAGGE